MAHHSGDRHQKSWIKAGIQPIDYRAFGVFCCDAMANRPTRSSEELNAGDRLSIRLDLASGTWIGPGEIAVLEAIALGGSISAAGRTLKMSYRRTWKLVEELNHSRCGNSGGRSRGWRRHFDEGRQGSRERLSCNRDGHGSDSP